MSRELYIIPECYADTNLISLLVHAGVNHQKGCTMVAGTMKDKFSDRFAIGVIDHDKTTPRYLEEMDLILEHGHLRLYKHPNKPHFLITIRPAIENFVLSCAEELKINTNLFGVSSSLEGMKKLTKRNDSNVNPKLRSLFQALQMSTEMTILRDTLVYLKSHQYQAKIEELKVIFEN